MTDLRTDQQDREDRSFAEVVSRLHAGATEWCYWWDGEQYRHFHADGSLGRGSICLAVFCPGAKEDSTEGREDG